MPSPDFAVNRITPQLVTQEVDASLHACSFPATKTLSVHDKLRSLAETWTQNPWTRWVAQNDEAGKSVANAFNYRLDQLKPDEWDSALPLRLLSKPQRTGSNFELRLSAHQTVQRSRGEVMLHLLLENTWARAPVVSVAAPPIQGSDAAEIEPAEIKPIEGNTSDFFIPLSVDSSLANPDDKSASSRMPNLSVAPDPVEILSKLPLAKPAAEPRLEPRLEPLPELQPLAALSPQPTNLSPDTSPDTADACDSAALISPISNRESSNHFKKPEALEPRRSAFQRLKLKLKRTLQWPLIQVSVPKPFSTSRSMNISPDTSTHTNTNLRTDDITNTPTSHSTNSTNTDTPSIVTSSTVTSSTDTFSTATTNADTNSTATSSSTSTNTGLSTTANQQHHRFVSNASLADSGFGIYQPDLMQTLSNHLDSAAQSPSHIKKTISPLKNHCWMRAAWMSIFAQLEPAQIVQALEAALPGSTTQPLKNLFPQLEAQVGSMTLGDFVSGLAQAFKDAPSSVLTHSQAHELYAHQTNILEGNSRWMHPSFLASAANNPSDQNPTDAAAITETVLRGLTNELLKQQKVSNQTIREAYKHGAEPNLIAKLLDVFNANLVVLNPVSDATEPLQIFTPSASALDVCLRAPVIDGEIFTQALRATPILTINRTHFDIFLPRIFAREKFKDAGQDLRLPTPSSSY